MSPERTVTLREQAREYAERLWPHCMEDCQRQLKRTEGKECCCGNLENIRDTEKLLLDFAALALKQAEQAVCDGCARRIPVDDKSTVIRMHRDPHSGGMMVCIAAAIASLGKELS